MASAVPPNKQFRKGKFSGLLLILFIVGLYLFQNKAILPFVEGVVKSDAFEADTSELTGKDRGRIAVSHCNEFVRDDLGPDHPVDFGEETKTWELAAGRYLVSSYVTEQDESGRQVRRNFACSVQFKGGDDMDRSNWSLQGLDMRVM